MLIDDATKRAMCRVDVHDDDGERVSRGTGFVVAPGMVLTAAHVVALESGALRGTSIWLELGTTVSWPAGAKTRVKAEIASLPGADGQGAAPAKRLLDVAGGWVLLACAVPAGVRPLSLERLRDGYGEARWCSFGYTKIAEEQGVVYDGTVKDRDRDYTLHCTQSAAGMGSNVRGLSGAPLLVHGHVVGLIQSAELEEVGGGEQPKVATVEGRLYATPIESVAAACPEILKLIEPPRVPYEDHLLDALGKRDGLARSVARRLAHPRVDSTDPDELRRYIVREMYLRGLETTTDIAVEQFDALGSSADLLVDLAETFWVPDRAARELSALPDRPKGSRAAAINASSDTTAEHYLRRAGALRTQGSDGWREKRIQIDNDGGEKQLAALEKRVRDHFLVDGLKTDAQIQKFLKADGPYVLVLQETVPRPEIYEELQKKFEGLVIVLLMGQAAGASAGAVETIAPPLAPGEEEETLEACSLQRLRVEKLKKKKKRTPS